MRTGLILSLVFWGLVIVLTSGCSFGVQIGWHGESEIDDREFTQHQPKR